VLPTVSGIQPAAKRIDTAIPARATNLNIMISAQVRSSDPT
jgi:hypothetical protein